MDTHQGRDAQREQRDAKRDAKRMALSETRSRISKEGWVLRRKDQAHMKEVLAANAPKMWEVVQEVFFGDIKTAWELAGDIVQKLERHSVSVAEFRELEAKNARMAAASEMLEALKESRRVHQDILDNYERGTTEAQQAKAVIKTIDLAIAKAVER